MCGIFGVIAKEENYDRKVLVKILEDVAKLSQVRGKDSSGLAVRFESLNRIDVLKGPVSIDELLKTKEYQILKKSILDETILHGSNKIFAALGHARLVTNGSQLEDVNNQPVVKDGIVGIHNGIIVNEVELWEKHSDLKREYEIDTEILFALIRKYLSNNYPVPWNPKAIPPGTDPWNASSNIPQGSIYHVESEGYSTGTIQSCSLANSEIIGTVSTGFFINNREEFVVYTNNGSLYILTNDKDLFIYGSEKNILDKLVKRNNHFFDESFTIKQVHANKGYLIRFQGFNLIEFDLSKAAEISSSIVAEKEFQISVTNHHPKQKQLHAVVDPDKFTHSVLANSERKLLEYNFDRISKLKRCTKCLLPETFPFIEFDEKGICNICKNYIKKNQPKPIEELQVLVEPYRKKNGEADCLIPFSGGRDSTYVLHYVKKVLKLNPITFTYDWGMVTDLARRNIARVCGKLGVENIIVSADIKKKRNYIKKNIEAWLKKPALGMIPIFMAGDKYFFKYANQVKSQNDIKLQIWGINFLENTDFKVGFAGVPPQWDKKMIYSMNLLRQLKLFGFVSRNLLSNPSYFNSSLLDTLGSFTSRYFNPRQDYYHFFDYHEWDESKIESVLFDEYDWETAGDLKSTWRIGDGTASFYNYIYYTVAGFSEFDTFRSNQIREGMITREEALKLVYEENRPRYESFRWYLEIIGLDFETVIRRINQIPKLY